MGRATQPDSRTPSRPGWLRQRRWPCTAGPARDRYDGRGLGAGPGVQRCAERSGPGGGPAGRDALGRARLLEAERTARQRTERLQQTMTALVASASSAEVTAAVFQHGLPPFGASAARLALADQQPPGLLLTLSAVGLPESVLAGWQELPATTPSPSRPAVATSAPVYLATLEDLAARYPEAHQVLSRSGHQAWVALPLRSGGRTLGVLTLAFPRAAPARRSRSDHPHRAGHGGCRRAQPRDPARQRPRAGDVGAAQPASRSLARIPGVRLGARYMPAETRYGIGGDWCDAVCCPAAGSCSS